MTIKDLQASLSEKLRAAGFENPLAEARWLMEAALNLRSTELLIRQDEILTAERINLLADWANERADGMPLAYLTGKKGFYKSEFTVTKGVLIPRPETELIVEEALARAPSDLADFGCGSGCIGLSIIKELPSAKLCAIDASPIAIAVAKKNAQALNLTDRTQFVQSSVEDWLSTQPLDMVVANPPYIPIGDRNVEAHVHNFEPHLALYSGPDGLEALRSWSRKAFAVLKSGGWFICEFGAGQTDSVREIISQVGFENPDFVRDLAGIERVAITRKS